MRRSIFALSVLMVELCSTCPLLAAIETERNDVLSFWPAQYTFSDGISSRWIPYGTYSYGHGEEEVTRVTSNLVGVVLSAYDGYLERSQIPEENRDTWPNDEPPTNRTVVGALCNAMATDTLRIVDLINSAQFIDQFYSTGDDFPPQVSVGTNSDFRIEESLLANSLRHVPGAVSNEFRRGVAAYFGGDYLDELCGGGIPPLPVNMDENFEALFKTNTYAQWLGVFPVYGICTNDPHFFPDYGVIHDFGLEGFREPIKRMLKTHSNAGRAYMEMVDDLLDYLNKHPAPVAIEDVLMRDTGMSDREYRLDKIAYSRGALSGLQTVTNLSGYVYAHFDASNEYGFVSVGTNGISSASYQTYGDDSYVDLQIFMTEDDERLLNFSGESFTRTGEEDPSEWTWTSTIPGLEFVYGYRHPFDEWEMLADGEHVGWLTAYWPGDVYDDYALEIMMDGGVYEDAFHYQADVIIGGDDDFPAEISVPSVFVAVETEHVGDDFAHWNNGTRRLDWKRLGILCQLERQMMTKYEYVEPDDLPLVAVDYSTSATATGGLEIATMALENGIAYNSEDVHEVYFENSVITGFVNYAAVEDTEAYSSWTNSWGRSYPTARAMLFPSSARMECPVPFSIGIARDGYFLLLRELLDYASAPPQTSGNFTIRITPHASCADGAAVISWFVEDITFGTNQIHVGRTLLTAGYTGSEPIHTHKKHAVNTLDMTVRVVTPAQTVYTLPPKTNSVLAEDTSRLLGTEWIWTRELPTIDLLMAAIGPTDDWDYLFNPATAREKMKKDELESHYALRAMSMGMNPYCRPKLSKRDLADERRQNIKHLDDEVKNNFVRYGHDDVYDYSEELCDQSRRKLDIAIGTLTEDFGYIVSTGLVTVSSSSSRVEIRGTYSSDENGEITLEGGGDPYGTRAGSSEFSQLYNKRYVPSDSAQGEIEEVFVDVAHVSPSVDRDIHMENKTNLIARVDGYQSRVQKTKYRFKNLRDPAL